jgi:hypothetical protein
VDPAKAFIGVEAENRTGAEKRRRLVLAVPLDRHGTGAADDAVVHAAKHLERMHD